MSAHPVNSFDIGHPRLDESRRIIVVSDIHGDIHCFQGLLKKIRLQPSDQLILLGDLVERGPESLATLRYAMSLRDQCRLYPVLGNHDFWHMWIDGTDPAGDEQTLQFLLRQKAAARRGLILDMCDELGAELRPEDRKSVV